jgi:uncharacterized cofD-like protein
MTILRLFAKWLTPGIGVKRWVFVFMLGVLLIAIGLLFAMLKVRIPEVAYQDIERLSWEQIGLAGLIGLILIGLAFVKLSSNILAPYRKHQQGPIIDAVYTHSKRHKGLKVVAVGGGTGLPSVLRGLKPSTSNVTAVVTVADDGGSSGRLRRDLGVLPPGDLRNNIAALADDENLMTHLFQYRFPGGELGGHAFGNLFIGALAGVTGSLETALIETARVLNIQGRVLPSTLENVHLVASVRPVGVARAIRVQGESKITEMGGQIDDIQLVPADVEAYTESVQAILEADLIVIGPGSLYTSILPNLLIKGIADALRATSAYKIYVCNVATQPGETDGFTVAEHVMALERHIGRGVFQVVLANNAYPVDNQGVTEYVQPAPPYHEILQRYEVRYTDLTDSMRPWRHDSNKLAEAILNLSQEEKTGSSRGKNLSFAKL